MRFVNMKIEKWLGVFSKVKFIKEAKIMATCPACKGEGEFKVLITLVIVIFLLRPVQNVEVSGKKYRPPCPDCGRPMIYLGPPSGRWECWIIEYEPNHCSVVDRDSGWAGRVNETNVYTEAYWSMDLNFGSNKYWLKLFSEFFLILPLLQLYFLQQN